MTHFGIACPSETSHLNAMMALGCELQKRGHHVTFFQVPDAEQKILSAGLDCKLIGRSQYPIGSMPQIYSELGKLSGMDGARYSLQLNEKLAAMKLRELPDAVKAVGVDALLVDQVARGCETVAEYLDIPFISVCNALLFNRENSVPPFFTSWRYNTSWWARLRNKFGYSQASRLSKPLKNLVNDYRQQWKLPLYFSPNDYFSKLAQVSQQPAEFEFPRDNLPECFHFTGPYTDSGSRQPVSFPYEKLTGQPLIYCSMGTLQNRQQHIFKCVAEACVGLDAQLVISLGNKDNLQSLQELPGSPLVVGYAPQLDLLKKASLVITHAGLNTTLESLSRGVPMVAIPITNDQPGVAARIAWTGTGEMLPLKSLDMPKLRSAITKVLREDSYKLNVLRLQEAINKAGGVNHAVDIIEQVVATGKPVLRNNISKITV
jgi:zeaxanthin glucosyltransferase